jgi:hypothetical protein
MRTTHTPGQWYVIASGNQVYSDVNGYVKIADVNQFKGSLAENDKTGEANARLIAAAPELLEAVLHLPKHLIEVADILTNHAAKNGTASVYDKVLKLVAADLQTIIAKATGEPTPIS